MSFTPMNILLGDFQNDFVVISVQNYFEGRRSSHPLFSASAVDNDGQMCGGPGTESEAVKLLESQSMIDFAIEEIIMGWARVRFCEGKSKVSHSGIFGEEADERTTSCRGRIELA